MNLLEQLQIVAADCASETRRAVMAACLTALGAFAAVWGAWLWCRYMTPVARWMRRHKAEALWLAPFVIALVYTGATKETKGRVEYPYTDVETRYLLDAGSYVTNGYAYIAFTRLQIVPETADLQIAVRPVGSTNDLDWATITNTTFAAFNPPQKVYYAGAETNVFQVFTTWTPGPAVHTNGVAVIEWQRPMGRSIHEIVTRRTGFYVNGERVAPSPGLTNGPPLTVYGSLNSNYEGEADE